MRGTKNGTTFSNLWFTKCVLNQTGYKVFYEYLLKTVEKSYSSPTKHAKWGDEFQMTISQKESENNNYIDHQCKFEIPTNFNGLNLG